MQASRLSLIVNAAWVVKGGLKLLSNLLLQQPADCNFITSNYSARQLHFLFCLPCSHAPHILCAHYPSQTWGGWGHMLCRVGVAT